MSSTPKTNEEWAQAIQSLHDKLTADIASQQKKAYPAPTPGTKEFAKLVDHTLLKTDADENGIKKICAEAVEYSFGTVCVRSNFVKLAKETLKGSDVEVCSVICFPEGTQSTDEKIAESKTATTAGAKELDHVLDHAVLRKGDYISILNQLIAIRSAFPLSSSSSANTREGITLKLILETSQLTPLQITGASLLASAANFDFVKTSTGFVGSGAKEEDVRLMRAVCESQGKGMGVKASGGIRTKDDAERMMKAGATRLGLSGSVGIVLEVLGQNKGKEANGGGY